MCAIQLVFGSIYAGMAFSFFERAQLRKIDLEHEQLGLTNGWERLRWGVVGVGLSLSSSSSSSSSANTSPQSTAGYTALPLEERTAARETTV